MSKSKILRVPLLGRAALVLDEHGEAEGYPGGLGFKTNVSARVIRNGKPVEARKVWEGSTFLNRMINRHEDPTLIDLGSGLVTNIGAMSLANDWNWASPATAVNTLKLANWHATGTGATAASALDFKIQTISANGGQTPIAGTQTIATATTMAVPVLQTVATIAYTGSEAVTEWGLHTSNTLSSTTGTPFTADTATSFTATATPFTASSSIVQGLQSQVVIPGTTTVIGLIGSNTTSVGTLVNNGTTGWFTQAAMTAGATPGTTETFTLRPVMWDHKVFAAINVLNGDSIQFTYKLTVTSGG